MLIWFSNWNLYKSEKNQYERFENHNMMRFQIWVANIIELHCINEDVVDFLLNNEIDLSHFSRVSIHTPNLKWKWVAERILWKIRIIVEKNNIKNIVIHPDQIKDFDILVSFKDLPLSIENMDNEKTGWKTVEEVWLLLDKYKFLWLTLDLQHCFVNDNSMKNAEEFHKKYGDRIVEYHISWYEKKRKHYKLFETKQNEIIDAWLQRDIPTIIESSLDNVDDVAKELDYILNN